MRVGAGEPLFPRAASIRLPAKSIKSRRGRGTPLFFHARNCKYRSLPDPSILQPVFGQGKHAPGFRVFQAATALQIPPSIPGTSIERTFIIVDYTGCVNRGNQIVIFRNTIVFKFLLNFKILPVNFPVVRKNVIFRHKLSFKNMEFAPCASCEQNRLNSLLRSRMKSPRSAGQGCGGLIISTYCLR